MPVLRRSDHCLDEGELPLDQCPRYHWCSGVGARCTQTTQCHIVSVRVWVWCVGVGVDIYGADVGVVYGV